MKKKKGILGKIIIGIIAIAVIGSIFGGKDSSDKKEVATTTVQEQKESKSEDNTTLSETETVTDNSKTEQTVTKEPEQPAKEQVKEEQPSSGVRKELKEFLESYEAFMDEYCEFMQSYNSSDLTMLTKYTQLLSKYTDFAAKAQAWEGEDLNAEYIHLFLGETELCADSVNSTVNGWIVQYADDEQIVLYYSEKLNPTQKTTDFVTKAVLDAKMDNQYADKTANITVTVSAVQAEVAEKAMPSEWGVYPTFSGTTITAIAE